MAEGRVYGRNPVLALLRSGGRRADEIAVLAGGAARSARWSRSRAGRA